MQPIGEKKRKKGFNQHEDISINSKRIGNVNIYLIQFDFEF